MKAVNFVHKVSFDKYSVSPYAGRVLPDPSRQSALVLWPFYQVPERVLLKNLVTAHLPYSFRFGHIQQQIARCYHKGLSDITTYNELWHSSASSADRHDESIKENIINFYDTSKKLFSSFFGDDHTKRTAIYWTAQNRQHRATRCELDERRPKCPKCNSFMRKAVYKMREGQKVRLFACPVDMYLIKQSDIFGPDGQPVDW